MTLPGLFSSEWRVRASSLSLLGDILYKITGRNGKMHCAGMVEANDDRRGDAHEEAKIADAIGEELKNKLLATVFILCSDVNNPVVSSASLQVRVVFQTFGHDHCDFWGKES